jgi:cellulose synthase/poly-beta-1,6-N-acetylglucosamine synthase-like glycosyltransferase
MVLVLNALLWGFAALILVPMAVLLVECLTALLPRRPSRLGPERPSCAVLIPAHNEETGIGPTIQALLPQLQAGDRLVVVADNCTDRTAVTARSLGAEAVERNDTERRGKGYALDFGLRFLKANPPGVVVIVDADCLVQPGSLDVLVRQAARGQPVQAAYVLEELPHAGLAQGFSAFAFKVKNLVRPLGLSFWGVPCLLTGTGMAFPWAVLQGIDLASGNIVEDMSLGIDLALAGHPPRFCPEAKVCSELPPGRRAMADQRQRWEHGHLQTLLTQAPRLLAGAVWQRKPGLLGLALELGVPPLSFLLLLWALLVVAAGALALAGGSLLLFVVVAGGGCLTLLAIFAVWFKFGREYLSFASLLAAPLYVLWKVPIYFAFFLRRQKTWNRAERRAPIPPDAGAGMQATSPGDGPHELTR